MYQNKIEQSASLTLHSVKESGRSVIVALYRYIQLLDHVYTHTHTSLTRDKLRRYVCAAVKIILAQNTCTYLPTYIPIHGSDTKPNMTMKYDILYVA